MAGFRLPGLTLALLDLGVFGELGVSLRSPGVLRQARSTVFL